MRTNDKFGGRNGDPKKAMVKFKKTLKKFEGTGIGVGSGLSLGPMSPIYKLSDNETVINVKLDDKGNTILTPSQVKEIEKFDGADTDEECPACDGDGNVGGDICDVCGGTGRISRRSTIIFKANGKEIDRRSRGGGKVKPESDYYDDDDD